MQCDMCGKEEELVLAEVEGTTLNVCKKCAKYGKIIPQSKPKVIHRKVKKEYKEPNLSIVDDYATIIRNAREKIKLNQEQFAKKVNEKESIIHKLEGARMRPQITLAKKLEKFLGITLIEEVKDETEESKEKQSKRKKINSKKGGNLTIGDLINLKK